MAGAVFQRLLGQLQAGVAGGAEQCVGAKLLTGFAQGAVFLAQVQANAELGGQRQIIIDDQLAAMLAAQGCQLPGFFQPFDGIAGFVAVLQPAGAAADGRFDVGQQLAVCQQRAVGNGVQATLAHEQKSSGRRRGTYWP